MNNHVESEKILVQLQFNQSQFSYNNKLKDICNYMNFRLMDEKKNVLSDKIKVWITNF